MYFDSKTFNPKAFGHYVDRIPNVTKNELARSSAIGTNEQAAKALSNQTGSLYTTIPYFGRIDGSTSQNNDGATDITSSSTTTFSQGFIVASRMDGWTERSFSKSITAGVDFMDNVAKQIADYKMEVKQSMILAMLKGIFSMTTTGSTTREQAAKEFIDKHTHDLSGKTGQEAEVNAASLNRAIQQACGDNKNIFKLVIMHSEVATNLENMKLLKYMTQTDSHGIERELSLGTWNGRLVLIDDNMPVDETKGRAALGSPTYTTYILGENSLILDSIGDPNPYEIYRKPEVNGGTDYLFVRDRFICGVDGISFERPVSLTASASNADLANGANWAVINDGTKAIPHKSIAIARILSKG